MFINLAMSFLSSLIQKKQHLQPCQTTVTSPDGRVHKEIIKDGKFVHLPQTDSLAPGYVVDTNPDLKVALVLPGLCCGSQDVVQDVNLLHNYGITHILSLGVRAEQFDGFEYKFVEALDLPDTDIVSFLEPSFEFLKKVKDSNGCVFIHCNAGISRSATVVIAYLIKECGMTFTEAFAYLKERREAIRPNDGFIKQLKQYENSLKTTI
ncbi:dual specificity protein phosphatase 19 [Schistocerca cancellata]|uniref:dual specificity protein phosphatase 19 n=1 Tax=Schistocerca cancellata TaxID=274614 RepID=UPI0021175B37|nr:dual specificity protein phosphatase 19 [Schistocerca cancellata]